MELWYCKKYAKGAERRLWFLRGWKIKSYGLQAAASNAVLLHRYLEQRLETPPDTEESSSEPSVPTRLPGLPEVAARERARHAISLLAQKGEDTQALEDIAFKLFLALEPSPERLFQALFDRLARLVQLTKLLVDGRTYLGHGGLPLG